MQGTGTGLVRARVTVAHVVVGAVLLVLDCWFLGLLLLLLHLVLLNQVLHDSRVALSSL